MDRHLRHCPRTWVPVEGVDAVILRWRLPEWRKTGVAEWGAVLAEG